MYAGRVVESAPITQLFDAPRHPYTKALLGSIPKSGHREHGKRLPTIDGLVPSLFNLPPGCRFAARCAHRDDHCDAVEPDLTPAGPQREVRCHYPLEAPEAN
jgi:peptide/nickel transport system ATP-binding protein